MSEATLLDDLGTAEDVLWFIAECGKKDAPNTAKWYALAERLRSHAARLREAMESRELGSIGQRALVNRINGGPLGKDEPG